MKNAQIQIKKHKVCVLSVWTDRTKRWANELGESNYKALANLRPGKSDYQALIPNKKDNSGTLTFEYKAVDQLDRLINTIKNHY